jgi:hypothetical protein
MAPAMIRLRNLQLVGPVALFGAVLGAEAAAYALTKAPSCEWLWYVNLKWFSMFQQSHYTITRYIGLDCEQFLCVALPLFAAALIGIARRRELLLAVASNVSFVYIGFVFYTWLRANSYSEQASLLANTITSSGPDFILLAVLIGLSLLSFVVSHVAYIQKAYARG